MPAGEHRHVAFGQVLPPRWRARRSSPCRTLDGRHLRLPRDAQQYGHSNAAAGVLLGINVRVVAPRHRSRHISRPSNGEQIAAKGAIYRGALYACAFRAPITPSETYNTVRSPMHTSPPTSGSVGQWRIICGARVETAGGMARNTRASRLYRREFTPFASRRHICLTKSPSHLHLGHNAHFLHHHAATRHPGTFRRV